MSNAYSSSFYGRGYKVKKALKSTLTSGPALKALCPMKNLTRIFHGCEKMKAKRRGISPFRHSSFISPRAWVLSDATPWEHTSRGFGSSLFQTTDKSRNIPPE